MADFIDDIRGAVGEWTEVTGFLAKNVIVQNKSHYGTTVWFGNTAPTDLSFGFFLKSMGDPVPGTVATKLWFNGPVVHVSETD